MRKSARKKTKEKTEKRRRNEQSQFDRNFEFFDRLIPSECVNCGILNCYLENGIPNLQSRIRCILYTVVQPWHFSRPNKNLDGFERAAVSALLRHTSEHTNI